MSLAKELRYLAKTALIQNKLQKKIIDECKTAAELHCYNLEFKFKYNHTLEEKLNIKQFLEKENLFVELLDNNKILYISWDKEENKKCY